VHEKVWRENFISPIRFERRTRRGPVSNPMAHTNFLTLVSSGVIDDKCFVYQPLRSPNKWGSDQFLRFKSSRRRDG
jgi:hypothetical protein